jgi:hypothetical protein
MPNRRPDPKEMPQDPPSSEPLESPLEYSGEVIVGHHTIPPKGPAEKQVHSRRPLPPVPNAPPKGPKHSKKDA